MAEKPLLILGGYGNTGFPLARLLLEESQVSLVLAGRSQDKAQSVANELNQVFPGSRVKGVSLDAANKEALSQACRGMAMVVVASRYTPALHAKARAQRGHRTRPASDRSTTVRRAR